MDEWVVMIEGELSHSLIPSKSMFMPYCEARMILTPARGSWCGKNFELCETLTKEIFTSDHRVMPINLMRRVCWMISMASSASCGQPTYLRRLDVPIPNQFVSDQKKLLQKIGSRSTTANPEKGILQCSVTHPFAISDGKRLILSW